MRLSLVLFLSLMSIPGLAQQRVDARNTHERLTTVLPLVGKGSLEDPVRPKFAPLPAEMDLVNGTGIIAWTFQVSDDGKYALVEFVARRPEAFQKIKDSKEAKVFEKGKAARSDIETEFKRYKKDFDIEKFGVRLP